MEKTNIEQFIASKKDWGSPNGLIRQDFERLLDAFAADGLVFSNEAQFQLKLGDVLQKMNPDWRVKLEAVSIARPSPFFAEGPLERKNDNPNYPHDRHGEIIDVEKIETDIVIEGEKPNDNVAIELKYKNAQVTDSIGNEDGVGTTGVLYTNGSENVPLFSQGAPNIGAHEFLEDVERLERLVAHGNRSIVTSGDGERHEIADHIVYGFAGKTIARGFAIIITNDQKYIKQGHSVVYSDFFFPQEKARIGGKQLMAQTEKYEPIDWNKWEELTGKVPEKGLEKKLPVKLSFQYDYQWHKYDLKGWKEKTSSTVHPLKYLILIIQ